MVNIMDQTLEKLTSNRNKMVYAICLISIFLLIMSLVRCFIYLHLGYFLLLIVPFLALTYMMIGLTEKIKQIRHVDLDDDLDDV